MYVRVHIYLHTHVSVPVDSTGTVGPNSNGVLSLSLSTIYREFYETQKDIICKGKQFFYCHWAIIFYLIPLHWILLLYILLLLHSPAIERLKRVVLYIESRRLDVVLSHWATMTTVILYCTLALIQRFTLLLYAVRSLYWDCIVCGVM